jgi:hypothetical protein
VCTDRDVSGLLGTAINALEHLKQCRWEFNKLPGGRAWLAARFVGLLAFSCSMVMN